MTAPVRGTDEQSGRPQTAQHYTLAPVVGAPEGYVAPGMPGAPVAGYEPSATAERPGPSRRTGLATATAVGAMLLGAVAYGLAPLRAEDSIGWLAIAPAAAVAWPLGRLGGRSRVLPLLGALLAAGALFLGQLLIRSRELHPAAGTPLRAVLHDALTQWRADLRPLDLVFYGIALVGGFILTRRTATRS
ncbi:hypothetical protein F7Q99_10125 [Streptomyces kaniharaensis]|uniref:Uncharacterized protein n=1 Tax=Streptomyces kaniharaensis TaxID=212423 RepID=A0A6N7KPG3_9ACTN|nr:hypothetical protein [Streptomyces kaniharaensis]MQS12635.1 hypothetical protein [Streptomyces kaniharaensis]